MSSMQIVSPTRYCPQSPPYYPRSPIYECVSPKYEEEEDRDGPLSCPLSPRCHYPIEEQYGSNKKFFDVDECDTTQEYISEDDEGEGDDICNHFDHIIEMENGPLKNHVYNVIKMDKCIEECLFEEDIKDAFKDVLRRYSKRKFRELQCNPTSPRDRKRCKFNKDS